MSSAICFNLDQSKILSSRHVLKHFVDKMDFMDSEVCDDLLGIMHHVDAFLSHNNSCFQCNITITNFLVLHTCEIRIHDVIGRTIHIFIS